MLLLGGEEEFLLGFDEDTELLRVLPAAPLARFLAKLSFRGVHRRYLRQAGR